MVGGGGGVWNGVRTASTSASGRPTPTARPRSSTTRRRTASWSARYANGVELILRNDGWLPLGSCPVRFEGDDGWVETGDSGKFVLSSPALLAGRKVAEIGGYPGHVPRARLPRLRQDAQPAEGQRRRGLLLAHRLPRRQHRALPGPQAAIRSGEERVHRRRAGQPAAVRSTREPWRI